MIRYECDKCGKPIEPGDQQRFIVRVEVFAADVPLEIKPDDLTRDHREDIRKLIDELARSDPDDVEDQTYRHFRFDLCPECHKRFLQAPLG